MIYDIKLSAGGGENFKLTGEYRGKKLKKSVRKPRYPVIPFLDAFNTANLDRLSFFDPNHKLGFISAGLSRKKDNVLRINSKYFKTFVHMNTAGVPRKFVFRYDNQNYTRSSFQVSKISTFY